MPYADAAVITLVRERVVEEERYSQAPLITALFKAVFTPTEPVAVDLRKPLSEAALQDLAHADPRTFVMLVNSGRLDNAQLTFAAEAAGGMARKDLALPVLERLSEHRSQVVREGAIYGLEALGGERALTILRKMSAADPQFLLRKLAHEAVEAF